MIKNSERKIEPDEVDYLIPGSPAAEREDAQRVAAEAISSLRDLGVHDPLAAITKTLTSLMAERKG